MYKTIHVRVGVGVVKNVSCGMICRRLGYSIGGEISHVQLINWVCKNWRISLGMRSQNWSFHVRLKVIQLIMVSMVSYNLPLIPRSKKDLEMCHTQ